MEIERIISERQSNLKRELQLLHNELNSIREKKVKGIPYLYRCVGHGKWKYLGKKDEGNDERSKLKDKIAKKEQELTDVRAEIESFIIEKVPENHLIVSKKFNGGILIRIGLRDLPERFDMHINFSTNKACLEEK